jgi:hypothetical protein
MNSLSVVGRLVHVRQIFIHGEMCRISIQKLMYGSIYVYLTTLYHKFIIFSSLSYHISLLWADWHWLWNFIPVGNQTCCRFFFNKTGNSHFSSMAINSYDIIIPWHQIYAIYCKYQFSYYSHPTHHPYITQNFYSILILTLQISTLMLLVNMLFLYIF